MCQNRVISNSVWFSVFCRIMVALRSLITLSHYCLQESTIHQKVAMTESIYLACFSRWNHWIEEMSSSNLFLLFAKKFFNQQSAFKEPCFLWTLKMQCLNTIHYSWLIAVSIKWFVKKVSIYLCSRIEGCFNFQNSKALLLISSKTKSQPKSK